jgi:Bacterial protein of unknown function (DUF916)
LLAVLMMSGGLMTVAAATPSPTAPRPRPSATKLPGTPKPPSKPKKTQITWGVQPSTLRGPNRRTVYSWPKVKPGTVLHDYVAVSNYSARPVTFRVYATDGFVNASGDLGFLTAAQKPIDVGSWVRLLHAKVTVPAHARVNEPLTLTVPRNATPGDHTGGMIASIQLPGQQVTVDRRFAVPMYMRITGPLVPVVRIEGTSATFHGTVNPFSGGGADVSYTVHNIGNVRLLGGQTVSVTGPFGVTFATVHPRALTELLPGQSERVHAHLSGVFPAGPLTVHVKVHPVQAHVPGIKAIQTPIKTVSHSKSMWAIPWPQLLLLLLLVGAGYGAWWWLRRRKRLRAAALAGAVEKGRREAAAELTKIPSNGNRNGAGLDIEIPEHTTRNSGPGQ